MNSIRLSIDKKTRIIAISDVHGHKELLEALIAKIDLKEEDVLIILGDFINRGIDSYETYQYVRTLDERKNTYVLKGNHESFIQRYLEDETIIGGLLDFLKKDYYETVVHSVVRSKKACIHDYTSEDLYNLFYGHDVVNYFKSRPIYLETDDHIFVHGGYDKSFTKDHDYLKYDHFNEKSDVQEKTVIVGHWPASNLRTDKATNLPYINQEKNIITIDGGVGVKTIGELNAFIIENGHYETISVNHFKRSKVVKTHQFIEEPIVYVNYPHYEIEVLEEKSGLSKCKHVESGQEIHVFNELLDEDQNLTVDYINKFFNLNVDDEVEVCKTFESCVLVKYNDEFGWLLKNQLMEAN